jgi:hypothetical protein
MVSNGDCRNIPSGKRLQFANLKMAIESSLIYPATKWWIVPVRYVAVYQRVTVYEFGFPSENQHLILDKICSPV